MADMSRNKTPMLEQNPKLRLRNFSEVALGYNEDQALQEAERCLHCSTRPCIAACPLKINIPRFLMHISRMEYEQAYRVITQDNAFPSICARVCTKERCCEAACLRAKTGEPVAISRLERYIGDWAHRQRLIPQGPDKKRETQVAVMGSGPSALACAQGLMQYGYDVTIYEASRRMGGLLTYGLSEFFLPKQIVQTEIEGLREKGVHFETTALAEPRMGIRQLFDMGYRAIYLGTQMRRARKLDIPGMDAKDVYSALEYMLYINLMNQNEWFFHRACGLRGKRVVVIGAGNAAMDCARSALRIGAKSAQVLYRRTEREMSAVRKVVLYARQEGVQFKFLHLVKEILTNERNEIIGVLCVDTQLGRVDASGRPEPVGLAGSEHEIACDAVISAVGQLPQSMIYPGQQALKTNALGGIAVDRRQMTSIQGVFAEESLTSNPNIVATIAGGKYAASCMHQYLMDGMG